jgi:hypothetical protein
MTGETPKTADAQADAQVDAQVIACPYCNARFAFSCSSTPVVDECGFESYRFECRECSAAFAGIVDPIDDTLLLTETAAI